MAENRLNPEPMKDNVQTQVDPYEVIKEVNEAMAILPKQRFGCFGRFMKYGVALLVLFAMFLYWNFLRSPPLEISKETTYITQPLTRDGTRVDYFALREHGLYPPEMKTDDNGYKMIVRELGDTEAQRSVLLGNKIEIDTQVYSDQVYEKLGLDPKIEPTMTYIESYSFLKKYCAIEGLDEKQAVEMYEKVHRPWTLDELPMMRPWLEDAGPVLDLVSEAVRKPTFCLPMIRPGQETTFVETVNWGDIGRVRSFVRMLQTRAHYRIGVGDINGAIDDVITCELLGRHMEYQGTLISRLVGIALQGIANTLGVAANRESQPTQEQIQRLVNELNSIPPRPNMDQTLLAGRYHTLDSLQTAAVGDKSLADVLSEELSAWGGINKHELPAITEYLTVDWNIVMRRVNELYDDLDKTRGLQLPTQLSLGDLFINVRSRHVGDLIASLYLSAFQAGREANHQLDCNCNLRRITLAMLIYEREHGTLPPEYSVDIAGNLMHSWRVLLLPYLGEKKLYNKIRLDEPWNSEYNRQFHGMALNIYQCPSAGLDPSQTSYSVVTGEHTAFQASAGKSLDDFGMNLILVVEREHAHGRNGLGQSVCWMDPSSELVESIAFEGINRRDKEFNGIGSVHPGGVRVGLRNGSARFVPQTIEPTSLQGLLDGTADVHLQY